MDKLVKICILQWMSTDIGIPRNEAADLLVKEARNLNVWNTNHTTLGDANSMVPT